MSELVETYRGCEIRYVPEAVKLGKPPYYTPCLPGEWFWTVQATRNAIDDKLGPEPPPPEPVPPPPPPPEEPEREWVERYRDVDIWLILPEEYYWAQVEVGYVALAWTLIEIRVKIDDILAMLYPDEEPPEGLLAQIIAEIKAWFEENIASRLQPVYDFIDTALAGARDAWQKATADLGTWASNLFADQGARIEEHDGKWDAFDTETLPDLHDTIEAMGANMGESLNQLTVETVEAINQKAVEIIGQVNNMFLLMDPMGFLKDPTGFINVVFGVQRKIAEETVIRSFWEGFEEGLEE